MLSSVAIKLVDEDARCLLKNLSLFTSDPGPAHKSAQILAAANKKANKKSSEKLRAESIKVFHIFRDARCENADSVQRSESMARIFKRKLRLFECAECKVSFEFRRTLNINMQADFSRLQVKFPFRKDDK